MDSLTGIAGGLPVTVEPLVTPRTREGVRAGDQFGLHFSKHAARRLEQRGLDLDGSRLERLANAVDQAEAKGSKDSLILLDEMALVVSVQNRTVVTAVDDASRKEHVFTNIDSVVIAP